MIRKALLLFAVVALVGGLVGTAFASNGGNGQGSPPDLGPAIAAQELHTDNLLSIDGVIGTGVGLTDRGRPSVVILTIGPNVAGLPRQIEGFPVQVFVTGEIVALHHRDGHTKGGGGEDTTDPAPTPEASLDPTDRFPRPVPIGVSTGHPSITAGTIGARVTDGTDVFALSNNHVYAATNGLAVGPVYDPTGDAVIQPGTYDGGVSPTYNIDGTLKEPNDIIGTLADFEPIKFDGSDNVYDAAIVLSSTGNLGKATPGDGYGTPRSGTGIAAFANMNVQKFGRTTGQTKGKLWATNVTVNVNYGAPGVAKFVGQLIVRGGGFSAGGDSGSLVVVRGGDDDLKPVGLLFAGSVNATIISPIGPVLTRFGVAIDGN